MHRFVLAGLAGAAISSPAWACGGFFCSNQQMDQSAERILFAIDEDAGMVETHVQISYVGEASEFAWVVPAPSVPELLTGSDAMFTELTLRTQPTFSLIEEEEFFCTDDGYGNWAYDDLASAPEVDYSSSSGGYGGINIVEQREVGPYLTTTLQAETSAGLLNWLQENGYDLPDQVEPLLDPYVAKQAYFVALKLASDKDTGDLVPLAMRYEATGAMIPIQLTSIAATPDMRLETYILGERRAVPDSYLHVDVNDIVIDWFGGGWNYEDAITTAADEAGGQAFATDYSGSSELMHDAVWQDDRYDLDALADATDPVSFMDEVMAQGFPGDGQMLSLWEEFLPLPDSLAIAGVTSQDFYNCLSCYSDELQDVVFDSAGFADAIDEVILEPLRYADALLEDYGHLTRLTSSVSPAEMTVDPTFVFNDDVEQEITKDRTATVIYHCGHGGRRNDAPRTLVLEDGRRVALPSRNWFWDNGVSEFDFLESLRTLYALVITDLSDSGEGEVIFDGREQVNAEASSFNADQSEVSDAAGCGCTTMSPAGGLAMLLGLLPLALRRRA